MRGTLNGLFHGTNVAGIIPAHAGNTSVVLDKVFHIGDHPRACGEHMLTMFMCCRQPGSSPRMRGTPADDSDHCPPFRDHPRACGEHLMFEPAEHIGQGSSPRMRGTQSESHTRKLITGIIPAHAGNTHRPRGHGRRRRDHPRACGEHASGAPCAEARRGSSPRMRGTRDDRRTAGRNLGIIPAHAGNTRPRRARPRFAGDHPRACGEHLETGETWQM